MAPRRRTLVRAPEPRFPRSDFLDPDTRDLVRDVDDAIRLHHAHGRHGARAAEPVVISLIDRYLFPPMSRAAREVRPAHHTVLAFAERVLALPRLSRSQAVDAATAIRFLADHIDRATVRCPSCLQLHASAARLDPRVHRFVPADILADEDRAGVVSCPRRRRP